MGNPLLCILLYLAIKVVWTELLMPKPLPVFSEFTILDPDEPINGEKDCPLAGGAGVLEYRVWKEGNNLMVRCALNNITQRINFDISWNALEDLGSRKVIYLCEFHKTMDQSDTSCEHRLRLPRPQDGERIICAVRSVNTWGQSTTSCASDVITLLESEYRHWKDRSSRKTIKESETFIPSNDIDIWEIKPGRKSGEWVKLPDLNGTAPLLKPSQPPKPFVNNFMVLGTDKWQFWICTRPNQPDWTDFTIRIVIEPHLEYFPPAITYRCELIFSRWRIAGNVSLRVMLAHEANNYETGYGKYLKRCEKNVHLQKGTVLRCRTTQAIHREDIGTHVFYCDYHRDKEYQCSSGKNRFNITTVELYKAAVIKDISAATAETTASGTVGTTNPPITLKPGSLLGKTLPWWVQTWPGAGAKLNSVQTGILGFNFFMLLLILTGAIFMIRTIRKKRRDVMLAEPCYCKRADKGAKDAEAKDADAEKQVGSIGGGNQGVAGRGRFESRGARGGKRGARVKTRGARTANDATVKRGSVSVEKDAARRENGARGGIVAQERKQR